MRRSCLQRTIFFLYLYFCIFFIKSNKQTIINFTFHIFQHQPKKYYEKQLRIVFGCLFFVFLLLLLLFLVVVFCRSVILNALFIVSDSVCCRNVCCLLTHVHNETQPKRKKGKRRKTYNKNNSDQCVNFIRIFSAFFLPQFICFFFFYIVFLNSQRNNSEQSLLSIRQMNKTTQ